MQRMKERPRRLRALTPDGILLLLSFAIPFAIYVFTLAPTILSDDSGEFQLVAAVLGVAHPTGYPLYTLLGFIFTHLLPFGDPAYRVNFLSALAAASALPVVYRVARELDVAQSMAFLSALSMGFAAAYWNYATIARAYGLNWLFIALVLLCFVRWSRTPTRRSFLWLALLYGLSLTHHSTMLFFALALVLGVLVVHRRVAFDVRTVVLGSLTAALPLLLYLYIPLRGDALLRDQSLQGAVLGIPRAVSGGFLTAHYLGGPLNVILGSFYTTALAANGALNMAESLAAYAGLFAAQYSWLGVVLSAIGLVVLARRAFAVFMVIGVAWLTDVLVVSRAVAAYGEGPELFTSSWLLAGICIGAGANALGVGSRTRATLSVGALSIVVLYSLWQNSPAMLVRRTDTHDAEYAHSTLDASLPRDSIIMGAWSQITPLHYVQAIEGVRRDVAVIQAPLAAPEGRALMGRALDEDRALYILNATNELVAIPLRTSPAVEHMLGAAFGHELSLVGFSVRSQQLELYWHADANPSGDYMVFVHLIDGRGEQINTPDQPPATEFFPTSLWRAGQTFRDVHALPALEGVNLAEVGIYDPLSGKRLGLPDGGTTVTLLLR